MNTYRGYIPGEHVQISLDEIKSVFDWRDLETQRKVLKRVNDYVANFESHPPAQGVLDRLLEVRDYFQTHIKSNPSDLTSQKKF